MYAVSVSNSPWRLRERPNLPHSRPDLVTLLDRVIGFTCYGLLPGDETSLIIEDELVQGRREIRGVTPHDR